MVTPKKGARLGAGPKHQGLMLAQQASDLFRHGRITTTLAKAKTLQPYAEKLITKGKQGDLAARRAAISKLRDRDVVHHLFAEVAPRFTDRNGGYTRVLKLGPRPGDNAPMALIELTERGSGESAAEVIEEGKADRKRGLFGRARKRAGEAAAVVADTAGDVVETVTEAAGDVVETVTEAAGDVVETVTDATSSDSSDDSSDDGSDESSS